MALERTHMYSLVRLSFIAVGIFAISSIVAVVALVGVQDSAQKAVYSWRQFADQASAEQRAFRAFVTQVGIDGMIDDYHQLAVTGDENLVPMIYNRGGGALSALAAYPVENASEEEVAAHATLQALIRNYMEHVASITAMHRAGRSTTEIIAAADIDDLSAVDALQTLADATARSMMADNTPVDSKSLILLDVRRLLGLEGLVQNANRFLVSDDPGDLDRVRQDIANMEVALERYARHRLSRAESASLQHLSDAMRGAEAHLIAGKDAATVSYDTRELQDKLLELEMLVYADAVGAQRNLQATLGEVSKRAGIIIVLVGVGAVMLIVGGAWLLVFRIGRRIKAITQTMRELADGGLDADIPAAHDRDEIGDMSRALLIFRDGMRANVALTRELAENSRLASLGAMVAGMAHELNTPIGNALAVSSTLEDQCKTFRKDLNSERILRSMLEHHAASLEDAATLIQRNLVRAAEHIGSFKQVAVDQTSGKQREFQLDDVLTNVVQSLQPKVKKTPFTLVLGEVSGVVMDSYPGALSQVVTNLIENGIRHGLAGRQSGKVEVNVRRLSPQLTEIVVSDDGAGIPEEIRPSIFNAFFTTKAGNGGSGLGLHIVKSIVSGLLGGEISAMSEPGAGARFVITLPNTAPAEAEIAQPKEPIYYAVAQHAA